LRRARRADGVDSYTARIVSLNCRMLEKPAANATSAIERSEFNNSVLAF
jgi:hypothetical protein